VRRLGGVHGPVSRSKAKNLTRTEKKRSCLRKWGLCCCERKHKQERKVVMEASGWYVLDLCHNNFRNFFSVSFQEDEKTPKELVGFEEKLQTKKRGMQAGRGSKVRAHGGNCD